MTAIVFTDNPSAITYAAGIDAKIGYPLNGVDMGGGVHAPKAQSQTTSYGAIVKHPTLSLWAYPWDPTVQAQAIALPVGATTQTLDASWIPAVT